ncbi:MAG: hypothetical protein F6K18_22930 [Okeania sp. SIO2C2]|uniref:hypothetical protein n=1 Tax=Okeania sp. SIO2C2 TaxID=2607787 RepID=UPI0013BB82B2|nr:hypothetical protein [Okeania sp. SIO2C2]NEP89453.1 hypothetical protein [Okeania sp. SIO2C2]
MKTSVNFASFTVGLALILLLTFGILQWLHISVGSFLDWVIGGACFWWLLLIVTVPWNIHFEAKEVLAEAAESKQKGITVDAQQVDYVAKLARFSLWIALALHFLSTVGLYTLAITGISVFGYVSSGAALLLTVLRPAIRLYQYLVVRLSMIRRELLHPRADIIELRNRFVNIEKTVEYLGTQLSIENPESFRSKQQQHSEITRKEFSRLAVTIEDLRNTNQAEHHQLTRDFEKAISRLSTDGKFLNHVQEIIRFIKEA